MVTQDRLRALEAARAAPDTPGRESDTAGLQPTQASAARSNRPWWAFWRRG
jgi:hypothetical protein